MELQLDNLGFLMSLSQLNYWKCLKVTKGPGCLETDANCKDYNGHNTA